MKHKKKQPILIPPKKTTCIILGITLLLSLAGCGEQDSNKLTTEQLSTAERITSDIIPEPNQPIDPMVNITTEQQTGKTTEATEVVTEEPSTEPQVQDGFKYTIYGDIDIYLPIDIENYLVDTENGKFFHLSDLAKEYGWEELDVGYLQYSTSTCNIMFEYPYAQGDYEYNPNFGKSCPVESLHYYFREKADGTIDNDHASDNMDRLSTNKNIVAYVNGKRPIVDNFYATLSSSKPRMAASKDLIIVIAYMLTSPCREKAENPFVGNGDLFEKYQKVDEETNSTRIYILP